MKKATLSTTLLLFILFCSSSVFSQYSDEYYRQKKEDYREFLKNHEYKNRPNYSKQELKAIPKKDRPDLSNEQNFIQTLDPSLGYVPQNALLNAHKQTDIYTQQNKTSIPGITWTERGPDNVGGRTRAIMWDPNDGSGKTVFSGGVAGGLWKNTDITNGSTQWTPINDFWDNIAITTLAYDPSNTTTMYAGTGEGFYNIDAVVGGGIWKSTNGGNSWSRLNSTSSFQYVQKIVVDPSNGDIYACTKFFGVQRSQDGGSSWTKVLGSGSGASSNNAADIEIGSDGTIYAAIGLHFSTDGVYSSTTGNNGSWTKLNTGSNGFPTSGIRRLEIACAPNNANVIYAIAENSSSAIQGLYKSSNKGSTWSSLAIPNDVDNGIPANDFTRGQAWYDLSIAVDPNDANTLFVGGIDLFRSTNGGSSWTQVSKWSNNNNLAALNVSMVHADQHTAVYKPGSSSDILFGNDGGVYYSSNATNATPTINTRINGYNVTQYYAAAINGSSGSNNMLAGAQDNGTQKYTSSGINSTVEVTGGDGAFCHIDQSNGNNQISQYVRNVIYRTTNNWSSGAIINNSQSTGLFINPSEYDDKEDIYYSGHANGSAVRLLRISDPFGSASSGTVVIASGSSDVSHISASPYASGGNSTLFVGTDAGDVYKVSNAQSGSPTINNIGSGLPAGNISCIAIGASEQQLLVTLSNYGIVSVWESTNGGNSWTNKEGNLPNMPVRWALYNPLDYNQVFLATEVGVWTTADLSAGSVDWSPTNTGLANVRTDMLQYRSSDNTIVAATHGRGLFTTVIPSTGAPVADFSGTPQTLCEGNTVTFTDLSANTPTGWVWSFPGGTPSSSTAQNPTITYNTAGTYNVTLTASNASGSNPITKNNYITVNGTPSNAGTITGSNSECENATGIAYSINSVNGASNYTWTVPNGATIASGQGTTNITVNFGTNSGNVSVTPSNSCGNGGSNSKAVTINVCSSSPVADFSGTPQTLCEGNTVTFTDLSANTPTGWVWSFPGGTPSSSTAQNPTITYNTAGTYNVTLTASNASGSNPITKTSYITVNSCGTSIITSNCGKVFTSYDQFLYYYSVQNAQDYELEFVPVSAGPTINYVRGTTNAWMRLSKATGLADNTTYNVRVRAKVGGIFGSYGNVCQITTPSSNSTMLKPTYCNYSYNSYSELIGYYPVNNVQDYELEFTPIPSGPTINYLRGSTKSTVPLSKITGLSDNTTYNVRVRAKVANVFGPYGNSCQITTPSPSGTTQLETNYCNKTYNSYNEFIKFYPVTNAQDYELELTPIPSGPVINYVRGQAKASARLSKITGLQNSTTYSVKVRAKVANVFGPYGNSCQITTPASARFGYFDNQTDVEASSTKSINLIIYPNPNQGEFVYLDLSGIQTDTELLVTDISGKIIQQQKIESNSSTISFNEKLNAGFYFITVVSGNQKVTKKLVVR